MKLCKLHIHNYRSIRDLEMQVPDMLILLGPNNHGKSNILRAIEFGLSTSAKPQPDDFFSFRDDNDNELWIDMTFNNLTSQERTTFQKYLLPDGTVRIRKTARLTENQNVEIYYNGYVYEPSEWWLQSSAWERLSSREKIEQEAKNVPGLSVLLETSGRITKQQVEEFQRRFIDKHRSVLAFSERLEEGPLLGQKNVAGGVLPEFFLIPAIRDLTEEVKVKTTTVFGRLLQRAVKEMAESNPGFLELHRRLQELINELNARPEDTPGSASELARLEAELASEMSAWGVDVSIQIMPPDLAKLFELGTQLYLNDGVKTLADKKGHGLQRAVIFALVRAWAKTLRAANEPQASSPRRASNSVFFAVEEPELFLHPHAQRQLFGSLAEISALPDHQVFLSTHSTNFVDLEHYKRIAIVTKPTPQQGTQVRQCVSELFAGTDSADRKRRFHMASWVNPDRGELFFAKKVVLVEGETEKAVLPYLARRLGCFDPNVTVIDCGSKHNIPLYIAILNAFKIPYCVVHDEDPLPTPVPSDWPEEKRREKQRTFELNEIIEKSVDPTISRIEILSPDFETVAGVPKSQTEKKGKALAALDHLEKMSNDQMPHRLAEVIRIAYVEVQAGGQ